jgi:hypothetical protein
MASLKEEKDHKTNYIYLEGLQAKDATAGSPCGEPIYSSYYGTAGSPYRNTYQRVNEIRSGSRSRTKS